MIQFAIAEVMERMEDCVKRDQLEKMELSTRVTSARVNLIDGWSLQIHAIYTKSLTWQYGHQKVSRKEVIERLEKVAESIEYKGTILK